MAIEDSHKKSKKRKNTKKNIKKTLKMESSQFPESDNFYKSEMDKNKKKLTGDKCDAKTVKLSNIKDESDTPGVRKEKSKKLRAEKKKNGKIARAEVNEVSTSCNNEYQDEFADKKGTPKEAGGCKMQKSMKMKRKNAKTLDAGLYDKLNNDDGQDKFAVQKDTSNEGGKSKMQKKMKRKRKNIKTIDISEVDKLDNEGEDAAELKNGNSKKARTIKKKDQLLINQSSLENSLEKKGEAAEDEVYEMSSGDEDSSKGMKKWIMEYHQSRPGLKVLQERIDDFIAAHEAQEEQARREREAKAAEGGWTVVVHHKGRKKTSDAESGTVVGSVSQAAVLDKLAKTKNKDAGPDFYRFQKREAHRNEIMMLQSKFEQDKKRIQQMRAERKFRPY
ncbi:ribosomal RNA-processing 7 homolog A [Olea europaea subsp. europaea]|uniref:Ribosomal RNA-processing 7 homolog A n=1 Tax=Olea europaea subsp. europaea TaxID=158383 RepID=A0A8S0V9Y0_OLEEU|nr:ribosomal RNA-processing 7 homolog A [Olea europaea subsp. europaea]